MAGRTPSRAAAFVIVASIRRWPWRTPRATDTVWLSLEISMTSGSRNSFQVQMKKKTRSTPIVGRLTGTTIRHSTCHRFAPSIRAASMISRGNRPRTEERR